jgi:hypothetical protein
VIKNRDDHWTEKRWALFLKTKIIDKGLVSYKELAALTLGHLNPPQVGTSIASKKTFQAQFPKRECWAAVKEWLYSQNGKCTDCGTRIELQVDHVVPREEKGDSADRLDNLALRCRRCNVTRRPSHKNGGKTSLTTEAALMWILFSQKPESYEEYKKLCRDYGLTMSDIRIQEAWVMSKWTGKE